MPSPEVAVVRDGPGVSAGRKVWLRLAAVGLVLGLLWGIPECVVRLIDPPLEVFRAIAFGGDANSEKLFMKDWRLHWKLRPGVATTFLNAEVRTDRNGFRGDEPVAGRRVVLVLGDSTPFGYRVGQAETFPARLEGLLNGAGGGWSVINAGVPGYSSWQVRCLAERLIRRWKPEVVVVCVGNNEGWPAEQSDRQIDDGRAVAGRVVAALSASRFLVWASEKLRAEQAKPFIAPSLEHAVPRVSREEFGENLRALVRTARAANARPVLVSPPVNLYWPPVRFQQFSGWEKWQAFYQSVQGMRDAGDLQGMLDAVNRVVAENPDSFFALWIKGVVVTDLGKPEEGREVLEKALECHAFPESCKRSYREVVAQVAREEKCGYLDVNGLFLKRAGGRTSQNLYLDWCHPVPAGHGHIAEALQAMIAGQEKGGEAAKHDADER